MITKKNILYLATTIIIMIVAMPSQAQVRKFFKRNFDQTHTLGDTIPNKGFNGRYDRGIVNHLFVQKKMWMTGLDVSYVKYDSEDTKFLSFVKDFSADLKSVTINPFVGYFIKPNVAIGVKMGYQRIFADLGKLKINVDDDLNIDITDMLYKRTMWRNTFFYRSYVGIDKGKRFGLYNETFLSVNMGNSIYARGKEDNRKVTDSRIREIQLGIQPGISVFVLDNIAAEVSFNVGGLTYCEEKQTTNGVSSGWKRASGANFKINILNINIGIVAYL